jgi:hypothetical protein
MKSLGISQLIVTNLETDSKLTEGQKVDIADIVSIFQDILREDYIKIEVIGYLQ